MRKAIPEIICARGPNLSRICSIIAGLYLSFHCVPGLYGATVMFGILQGGSFTNLADGTDYEEFRAEFVSAGHTLKPGFMLRPSELVGVDILGVKIPVSSSQNFRPEEISAIHDFVAAGHNLLVVGEVGGGADTIANFNALVSAYGIVYGANLGNPSLETVNGFIPHEVTAGVNLVGIFGGRPMSSISSPSIDLTLPSGDADILAVVEGMNGSGRAVFVSDHSWWRDGDAYHSISFGDNRRLLQNTINYLSVPEPSALIYWGVAAAIVWRQRRCPKQRQTKVFEEGPEKPLQ